MYKEINKEIRAFLARVILRGAILREWTKIKFLCLEKIYIKKLVSSSLRKPFVKINNQKRKNGALRKILFIGDIMWEGAELLPELAKICEVVTMDLRPMLNGSHQVAASEVVCHAIKEYTSSWNANDPDAILMYARGGLLSKETFELIRKRWSCPLLGMNLDDKVSFLPYNIFSAQDDNYQHWAKYFDLNITSSKIASNWYREVGCNSIFTPQGVHLPIGLKAPTSCEFKYPISFLGTKKLDRSLIVKSLEEAGIPITLFGRGWCNSKWTDDASSIFRASQINLGIGLATPNLTALKGRDFECPGIGACYLTTFNWELTEFWDIGKEILCYRNVEELIEIFSWYRKRPEECLKIAQAAWNRSVKDHTWEKRFIKIFDESGF
jgi:hypothetical protein